MTRSIGRRTLLVGAAGAIAVIGSGAAAVHPPASAATRPADAAETAYAKLLAEVHDDYTNGRVVEHNGWVLSQHEFDTIASRHPAQKSTAFPQ